MPPRKKSAKKRPRAKLRPRTMEVIEPQIVREATEHRLSEPNPTAEYRDDCVRIQLALRAAHIEATLQECYAFWSWYSESRWSASWIGFTDQEVADAIVGTIDTYPEFRRESVFRVDIPLNRIENAAREIPEILSTIAVVFRQQSGHGARAYLNGKPVAMVSTTQVTLPEDMR